jgi:chlorobactene glucosyltransferase
VHVILTLMFVNGVCWALTIALLLVEQRFAPPMRKDAYGAPPPGRPKVSILIPARNEERNIERCLAAVLAQDYDNWEVFVTDDQSEDRTAAIVREFAARDGRVHLIEGRPLPAGWKGKGWALWQAHQRATGDYVLLLDADTKIYPHALTQTLGFAIDRQIDFLNPTPYFELDSFWEKCIQSFVWDFVLLRFPKLLVNSPWFPDNMAFGPFLLIRKAAYDAVDGHRRVCHSILEDVLLSKEMKRAGFSTFVVDGSAIFEVRMYTNFHEVLQGWTKTAFASMNYNLPLMLLAILGMFCSAALPFITLPVAAVAYAKTGGEVARLFLIAGVFQVAVLMVRRFLKDLFYHFPLPYILTHPFAVFVVIYMQFDSTYKYYFGAVTWKGRSYAKS